MSDASGATREPIDPIAAVTHPDPYPYYARLVAERPLHRDDSLGLWIASSGAAVTAVLESPACRVRPRAEPVPSDLVGSPAATIFRRLVRMIDGPEHDTRKRAIAAALDGLDDARIVGESERCVARLLGDGETATHAEGLTALAFAASTDVLASLLGFSREALPDVSRRVGEVVRCLFPGGTADEIELGKRAADPLRQAIASLLQHPADEDTLLARLSAEARRVGCDDREGGVANAIGLLAQAYDATAGLVGSTLLAFARERDLHARVTSTPGLLRSVVDEVLRHDAPVQNTRRFVAEPVEIEGRELRPGDVVLVVLAAANRDPAANPDPDRFDPARHERRLFGFGTGPHACPGRRIATAIASAVVARLLAGGVVPCRLDPHAGHRPSANCRIPRLLWRCEQVGESRVRP